MTDSVRCAVGYCMLSSATRKPDERTLQLGFAPSFRVTRGSDVKDSDSSNLRDMLAVSSE